MDDVEQQCEDALFELCDARERYPSRCADELQKSIKLKNEINMLKVFKRSTATNEPFILSQNKYLNLDFNKNEMCLDHLDFKLQDVVNKLNNLKAVMDQIEREKTCWVNKLLES
ncbi:uncharacterized protein LOC132912490 [Bombus pascuorum]|uniref:uncharacterized protein LOC132912490 n=1 Tax=Bombus pascuorum TaxID=65598 RepID=UPI0021465088|nr:uncharacterized protein LOC132912490 [Bombus pascuorum]XP_060825925.1 uncharacterized protein LOC132912490 [Bombus pascuorum]